MLYDCAIVGGGIVGLASAYKIQKAYPDKNIIVLDKEAHLASHQTGRNSGVIHSGLYYKPGSYRAKNCVNGRKQLVDFVKTHGIAHDICGKIVVATDESELERLDGIYKRGLANGLEGLKMLNSQEIKEIEPFIEGIQALWVPEAGIVDFVGVTNKLAELIRAINPNSKISLGTEVLDIHRDGHLQLLKTNNGIVHSKCQVFCAGLQSDRMARKDEVKSNIKIVGFRGDYYDLTDKGRRKINNLVYPVPNPEFPFLGVHFTRMTDGTIECGPNAVFTFKREGYGKLSFNLKDAFEALSYKGTWKLFFKHWRFGMDEYKRAFSKTLFLKQLQRMLPSLEMDDIEPGRSGVRAMALSADGDIYDDFKIERTNTAIHVLNAPSPAATACLSIADEVLNQFQKNFGD